MAGRILAFKTTTVPFNPEGRAFHRRLLFFFWEGRMTVLKGYY